MGKNMIIKLGLNLFQKEKKNLSEAEKTSEDAFESLRKQNFGLSPKEFEELVKQLKLGNDKLFGQVILSHIEECRSFLCRECRASYQESYDATIETFISFRQSLIEDKIRYDNLRYYFTQNAKRFYIKKLQKENRIPCGNLDEVIDCKALTDNPKFDELLDDDDYEIVKKALAMLPAECSSLLECHFYDKLQLKTIAQLIGETDASVRKRKERCIEKLRAAFNSLREL